MGGGEGSTILNAVKILGCVPGVVVHIVVIFEPVLHIIVPLGEGAILCVLVKERGVTGWPRLAEKRNVFLIALAGGGVGGARSLQLPVYEKVRSIVAF